MDKKEGAVANADFCNKRQPLIYDKKKKKYRKISANSTELLLHLSVFSMI